MRSVSSRSFKALMHKHDHLLKLLLVGLVICVFWTIGAGVWPGLRNIGEGSTIPSGTISTLDTLATISAASIALTLTVALIGLQLLSRYGAHAGRMVVDKFFVLLVTGASTFGVGVPLWATVEPWLWLIRLGFILFVWSIFVLVLGGYLILFRLTPQWLTLRTLTKACLDLPQSSWKSKDLETAKSILLEISAGTNQSEQGWNSTLRAIALVGLAQYSTDDDLAKLLQLIDDLVEKIRLQTGARELSGEVAVVISTIGLSSNNNEVILSVIRAFQELVQDAIQQNRSALVNSLLDETANLLRDRLQVLLKPATIDWLAATDQIVSQDKVSFLLFSQRDVEETNTESDDPGLTVTDRNRWTLIREWISNTSKPSHDEWKFLNRLVPIFDSDNHSSLTTVKPVTEASLVSPEDVEQKLNPNKSVNAKDLTNKSFDDEEPPSDLYAGQPEQTEPSLEIIETVPKSPNGKYDANDLIEAGINLFESTCASPTPNDITWPGGWRGTLAYQSDIERITSIGISLYESGRYPPTDRIEKAVEALGAKAAKGLSISKNEELPNITGWRTHESVLDTRNESYATNALKRLAIKTWQAGFAHRALNTDRALHTVRRLQSIYSIVARGEDPKTVDDVSDQLGSTFTRTAGWSPNNSLAETERGRQFVLNFAPDLTGLGYAVRSIENQMIWQKVLDTLDWIGCSVAGAGLDVATECYKYFLSGTDSNGPLEPYYNSWDVVSWNRQPICQPVALPSAVQERLFLELCDHTSSDQPELALLSMIALWRSAFKTVTVGDRSQRLKELREFLTENVLNSTPLSFTTPELWTLKTSVEDVPPDPGSSRIHWRLYDVAKEMVRQINYQLVPAIAKHLVQPSSANKDYIPWHLPPVTTPDADLRSLFGSYNSDQLLNERHYWGIKWDDDCLVLVQEADGSRRLLRDCEGRVRGFSWGCSGRGAHNLASVLVSDILGNFAYCPSCYGTISVGAGLIVCPSCNGDGLRLDDLRRLRQACYNVTAQLSKQPDSSLASFEDSPAGAQWHITRTELIQRVFHNIELLDEEETDDVED